MSKLKLKYQSSGFTFFNIKQCQISFSMYIISWLAGQELCNVSYETGSCSLWEEVSNKVTKWLFVELIFWPWLSSFWYINGQERILWIWEWFSNLRNERQLLKTYCSVNLCYQFQVPPVLSSYLRMMIFEAQSSFAFFIIRDLGILNMDSLCLFRTYFYIPLQIPYFQ